MCGQGVHNTAVPSDDVLDNPAWTGENERPLSDPCCRICQNPLGSSAVIPVSAPVAVPVHSVLVPEQVPPDGTTALDSAHHAGTADESSAM